MRCFKSFFKHTWHPQQMENSGRFHDTSKPCDVRIVNETELGELKTSTDTTGTRGVPCYNGACKASGIKSRPEHRIENPWHYLKTLFLVSIIVALVVWILVYVLLSQYDFL